MAANLIKINPAQPEETVLEKAAQVLQEGGVMAFPTDTSYGLAVNPYDDQAVEKVYQLKGRDFDKPLLLLINDVQQLKDLTQDIAPDISELVKLFWPGPLTLVFSASERLTEYKIGSSGKIGIRLPASQVARSIVSAAQMPITATSANPTGQPSSFSAQQVREYFGEKLDLIIDGGSSQPGLESTVLDVSMFPARVLRRGAVSVDQLSTIIPLA